MAKGATTDIVPEDPTKSGASARPAKRRTPVVPGSKLRGTTRLIVEAAASADLEALGVDAPASSFGPAPTSHEPETDSEGRAMVAALMDRMIDEHVAKWAEARTRTRAILAQLSR